LRVRACPRFCEGLKFKGLKVVLRGAWCVFGWAHGSTTVRCLGGAFRPPEGGTPNPERSLALVSTPFPMTNLIVSWEEHDAGPWTKTVQGPKKIKIIFIAQVVCGELVKRKVSVL
jgi:hypothetical protein